MVTTFRSVNNRAVTNLNGAVLAGAGTWTVVDGSVLPVSNFMVTCENEIALCTSRIGNVLTVTRAQDGTAASGHPDTVSVESRVVASLFTDAYAAINAIELGTDDLTTYLKLAGRSGGQTAQGGTAAADSLTLESTANAVKGRVRSLDGLVAQRFLRVGALTDPVNVVDGDATVARLFVNNDSNFSFSVVASNPRWLADSTDFIDYVRASNYFSVSVGGVEGVRLAAGGVILNALYTAAGDLEYASAASTPVRLAISVPAVNVRNVLGVDNGDTVPSWKTVLDAVSPTAMVMASASNPGTSLVFSHRDHLHATPIAWDANPHLLIGPPHSDTNTLGGIPVRGDIIVANVTPAWSRVAKGAAGSLLSGDGTDTAWTINPRVAGYARVGSAAAPTNVAAGDLTIARLFVTDAALNSEARLVQVIDAFTPVAGAFNSMFVLTTASPGVGLAADEVRAAKFSMSVSPTANYAGQASGLYNEAVHGAGAFNIAEMNGHFAQGIQNVALTTVTLLRGMKIAARAITGTITTAIGLEIFKGIGGDAGTVGAFVGLRIGASTPAPTTDIAIQSLGGHHRFVGGLNIGTDVAPAASYLLDVHGSILVDNNQNLAWRDSVGTARSVLFLGADNELNFLVAGGAGKHFRVLNQAGAASLWQITNAGVQDINQLYSNGALLQWQDSVAVTRSVIQLATDDYVNLFVAGGAGKKVRVLNQAGSVENFGVDQSGNINFIGWKDVTNIALPSAPAANTIREFSFAKATGAYQDTPRWLDSSGHDSGPNMRAKNAIPLPLDPVSTALTSVIPSATLGIIGMVTLKTPITVHTISYNIGTVAAGVNGVIRIAVYTESGALIINTTDSPGLVTGVQTKTLAADVYLPAGNYKVFFCMSVNETVTNPAISCFTQEGTYRAVASEDILCGTVVVTGGAAPNPHGTITSVANRTPYFKFGGAAT